MPSKWEKLKRSVRKEAQKLWGPNATLVSLEIWEPEGTYGFKRNPVKRPRSSALSRRTRYT